MSDTSPTLEEASSPAEPTGPPVPRPPAPSRSKLSSIAALKISEYTAGLFQNNVEPGFVFIQLKVDVLYSTFCNSLKPIVYGNFRNIGARTLTDNADTTLLNNVIRTVATNACVAAYAVMHTKALKIDSSAVNLFGSYNPVDCLRFPALTTLLVSALGPVETDCQPYRVRLIPYIEWTAVNALLAQTDYTSHLYELFLQAMKRGRTVTMTDVDLHSVASSHWWTMFMDNYRLDSTGSPHSQDARKNTITAYCPFRFSDRDHSVILGSFVLENTLYEIPGPLVTATVGPFATMFQPTVIDNIPQPFRSEISINVHYPAIFVKFVKICHLTNAQALAFGPLQNDDNITKLCSKFTSETSLTEFEYDPDYTLISGTKKRRLKAPASASHSGKRAETQPSATVNASSNVENATAGLWIAVIHYFDHQLLNKVPILQRSSVVTTSNQAD